MDNWFGQVRWCEDDLKNALELQGYPATKNNVSKRWSAMDADLDEIMNPF